MGRGTRAEKGREGARTCQDHKDSRDESRCSVRVHQGAQRCSPGNEGVALVSHPCRGPTRRNSREWLSARSLHLAPPIAPVRNLIWQQSKCGTDLGDPAQREVVGAAARSQGSLGDPHCDPSRNTLAEFDNARGKGWGA